jgi:hypothetical protein
METHFRDHWLAAVRSHPDRTRRACIAALTLAPHLRDDGTATIGQETLADQWRQPVPALKRGFEDLEAAGLIERSPRKRARGSKRWETTTYGAILRVEGRSPSHKSGEPSTKESLHIGKASYESGDGSESIHPTNQGMGRFEIEGSETGRFQEMARPEGLPPPKSGETSGAPVESGEEHARACREAPTCERHGTTKQLEQLPDGPTFRCWECLDEQYRRT